MDKDSWKELLSFECNVTGIKFYKAYKRLHPVMSVKLVREKHNAYDDNAITHGGYWWAAAWIYREMCSRLLGTGDGQVW